jgi:hypothetical protein
VQSSALIVTTTHAGVLDSSVQNNKNDPVWHNHFVSLIPPPPGSLCAKAGAPFQVDKLTFNQPGRVTVTPGNHVRQAEAFDLVPLPSTQNLQAVCVDNVTPAERIFVLP